MKIIRFIVYIMLTVYLKCTGYQTHAKAVNREDWIKDLDDHKNFFDAESFAVQENKYLEKYSHLTTNSPSVNYFEENIVMLDSEDLKHNLDETEVENQRTFERYHAAHIDDVHSKISPKYEIDCESCVDVTISSLKLDIEEQETTNLVSDPINYSNIGNDTNFLADYKHLVNVSEQTVPVVKENKDSHVIESKAGITRSKEDKKARVSKNARNVEDVSNDYSHFEKESKSHLEHIEYLALQESPSKNENGENISIEANIKNTENSNYYAQDVKENPYHLPVNKYYDEIATNKVATIEIPIPNYELQNLTSPESEYNVSKNNDIVVIKTEELESKDNNSIPNTPAFINKLHNQTLRENEFHINIHNDSEVIQNAKAVNESNGNITVSGLIFESEKESHDNVSTENFSARKVNTSIVVQSEKLESEAKGSILIPKESISIKELQNPTFRENTSHLNLNNHSQLTAEIENHFEEVNKSVIAESILYENNESALAGPVIKNIISKENFTVPEISESGNDFQEVNLTDKENRLEEVNKPVIVESRLHENADSRLPDPLINNVISNENFTIPVLSVSDNEFREVNLAETEHLKEGDESVIVESHFNVNNSALVDPIINNTISNENVTILELSGSDNEFQEINLDKELKVSEPVLAASKKSEIESSNNGSIQKMSASGNEFQNVLSENEIMISGDNDSIIKSNIDVELKNTDLEDGFPNQNSSIQQSMFSNPQFRSFVFNPSAQSSDIFQTCLTSKNESGHCRYVQHCILPSLLGSINSFINNVCVIKERYVGVCCPEFPVSVLKVTWKNNFTDESQMKSPVIFPKECGIGLNTRIVGGENANVKAWPWMVALMNNNKVYCGGALINNRYVLTAAHCTFGVRGDKIIARLGEYDLGTNSTFEEEYFVTLIKRHGQYSRFQMRNDIALLKLDRPVQFNEFVQSICLSNTSKERYIGRNATLAGWGYISVNGVSNVPTDILQEANFPIIENSKCEKSHSLPVPESFICAEASSNDKGACNGDSGGPLMLLDKDGRWKVIGLVSWGRRGCNPIYPTVYTRVNYYLNWIKEHST